MAAHRLRKLGQWRISNHRPPKVWISMMFSQKAKNTHICVYIYIYMCVYLCDSSYILPLDPPAKLSTVPKKIVCGFTTDHEPHEQLNHGFIGFALQSDLQSASKLQ